MNKQISNEAELLRACINGNNAAYESIVCKYQSLVCGITYSATGNVDKSEELAHETFVRAWKNLTQLRELGKFRSWLCAIANNTIKDHFRKQKQDMLHNAGALNDAVAIAADTETPRQDLVSKEEQTVVDTAISRMPESYRQVFVLYYRQEQSIRQVAAQLDISEDNVRTRLSRGRKMLKERVASMVEKTLSRTGPSKAFTAMVTASVAGIAIKGAAAAATGSVTAAGSASAAAPSASGGISALLSTVTAKLVTAAAVIAVGAGAVITYKNLNNDNNVTPPPVIANNTEDSENIASINSEEQPDKIAFENTQTKQNGQTQKVPDNTSGTQTMPPGKVNTAVASTSAIEDARDSYRIIVKVIEKQTGKPIPNAPVRIFRGKAEYYNADENGEYIIKVAKNENSINIFAQPKGYVWQSFSCGQGRLTDYFPEEVIFALDKGTVVSGMITDSNGNPVQGASAGFFARSSNGINDDKPGIDLRFEQKTGKDGKWRCISAPANLDMCSVSAKHPDFSENANAVNNDEIKKQLRKGSHVLALSKGYSLAGIVTDESGKPIKAARVLLGNYYGMRERQYRTHTDAEGAFGYDNMRIRETDFTFDEVEGQGKVKVSYPIEHITVTAYGFAPKRQKVYFKQKNMNIEFVLDKGDKLAGKVVDINGNPVEQATVRVDEWVLPNVENKHLMYLRSIDWNTRTDAQGRFVWENAPEGQVELYITKSGFMRHETSMLQRGEDQREFVIHPNINVTAKVIDQATKKPVTEFIFRRHEGHTVSSPKRIFSGDGTFSTAFEVQGDNYTISVQADGYRPARSRNIKLGEQDVELAIEMIPDSGIYGVIVDAEGNPVDGVDVVIPKHNLSIYDMKIDRSRLRYHHHAVTDKQGTFHIGPVEAEKYTFLVLHEKGYILATPDQFPKDRVFVLQPYAKIVGDYYKGSKPQANVGIRVDYPRYQYYREQNTMTIGDLAINYGVKTDENGTFIFDKLIHGNVRILSKPYRYVNIKTGETKEIMIGGTGRIVTGRILDFDGTPLNTEVGMCSFQLINTNMSMFEKAMPAPDDVASMNCADLLKWYMEFINSEKGRDLYEKIKADNNITDLSYGLSFDDNGRFEHSDISPGRYFLSGKVYGRSDPNETNSSIDQSKTVCHAAAWLDVPAPKTQTDLDKVIDLGVILCDKSSLKPGDPAPAFEIEKLKSKGTISLKDYKGKAVLINFTSPALKAHEPEKAAALEKLCRQVDLLGSVSILNIAVEMLPWNIMRKKMITECSLPGEYGVIMYQASEVFVDYELHNIPESVLVGPDGKILYKGAQTEELLRICSEQEKR